MLQTPAVGGTSETAGRAVARRWLVPIIGVGAYVILAVALFWPTAPWSSSRLPAGSLGGGYGDPAQMTWFLEWVPFALRHGISIFHTNYLNYPRGVNLADATLMPLLGLVSSPITLTLGPIATYNILIRLAFAGSSTSMFFVLRSWCRWPAAFLGGLAYGFGPYMIAQGHNHLNLIFIPIPPLIVWCVFELIAGRRHRPARIGVLLGALAAAQALIDAELLALLAVVVLVGVLGVAVASRRQLRQRFEGLVRATVPALAVFLVVASVFLWNLLFGEGHIVGPVNATAMLQGFRADALGPIVPTVYQFIAPAALVLSSLRYVGGNVTENASYLGLPLVALVVALAIWGRRHRLVTFSAALAAVAYLLSLGSRLTVNGRVTDIPLPEAVLAHLPLLDGIVPARFAMVASLFTVIAVAVGGDRFFRGGERARRARLGEMGMAALMITSAIFLLPLTTISSSASPWSPAVAQTVETIPRGSVVLTYPFTLYPWTEAMSWQADDGMRFRLIGGYVAAQDSPHAGGNLPPILRPSIVQAFLVGAQDGLDPEMEAQTYYPVPSSAVNIQSSFCTFLARYHVNDVLFWKVGAHPATVEHLFSAALGSATSKSSDRTLLIWTTSATRCRP